MIAWRRRREQRQTPGALAVVAVHAFDTAVSKAGAERVVEAAVHGKGSRAAVPNAVRRQPLSRSPTYKAICDPTRGLGASRVRCLIRRFILRG